MTGPTMRFGSLPYARLFRALLQCLKQVGLGPLWGFGVGWAVPKATGVGFPCPHYLGSGRFDCNVWLVAI